MSYGRLPLPRQFIYNFFIVFFVAILCIYLGMQNVTNVENKNKIRNIDKRTDFFLSTIRLRNAKAVHDIINLLSIDKNLKIELPDNIIYFSWHNIDEPKEVIKEKSIDFAVPEYFINNYEAFYLNNSNTDSDVIPNRNKPAALYCASNTECFYFIHNRVQNTKLNGHTIIGFELNNFITQFTDFTNYPTIIFFDENISSLEAWKNHLIDQNTTIINSLNTPKYNTTGKIPDTKTLNSKNLTIQAYIDLFRSTWDYSQDYTFSEIDVLGNKMGYVVAFIPSNSFYDLFINSDNANILRSFIIFLIISSIMFYYGIIIYKTVKFVKDNKERIQKYTNISVRKGNSDVLTLVHMIDNAIKSAEERDQNITYLNAKLALFDNYDNVTSLPNEKWLKEQIKYNQQKFAIDNSIRLYLTLFTPTIPISYLKNQEIITPIVKEIKELLGENNPLVSFNDQALAIISLTYNDVVDIEKTLDDIKKIFVAHVAEEHKNFHLKAGIVNVISEVISSDEIINQAQIALNHSLEEPNTDQYVLYNDNLNQKAVVNSMLKTQLSKARVSGELVLKYNTVYNVKENKINYIVANPFWINKGELRALSNYKADIIRCGLNIEYSYWYIENCFYDLNLLDKKLATKQNIVMTLNSGQLTNPNLIDTLDTISVKYSIMPSRVTFLISEQEISTDLSNALDAINELVKNGFNLCLIDYGLGYANGNFLEKNKVRSVSLSSAFTKKIVASEYDNFMISKIIEELKSKHGIYVEAKAVDNILAAKTLAKAGVEYLSGTMFPHDCSIQKLISDIDNFELENKL